MPTDWWCAAPGCRSRHSRAERTTWWPLPAPAPDTELRIHLGPLASGAAVLADSKVSERLLSLHRKLLGIDMETYGVFCAASEASVPRPQPLVIKGICDFADEEKGDDLQRYAAYTSACVLARFAEEWL